MIVGQNVVGGWIDEVHVDISVVSQHPAAGPVVEWILGLDHAVHFYGQASLRFDEGH